MRRFVLQAIDPEMDCPVLESCLVLRDSSSLRTALGEDADDDPQLSRSYYLSSEQFAVIVQRFGVAFDAGGRPTVIEPWRSIRRVPYLVHTGFELALMLDGRKPLAVFNDRYPSVWFDELISRFDPYVADGRFVRRIIDHTLDETRLASDGVVVEMMREVYVAARGEEWRIEAFLLLRQIAHKIGWNDTLERLEGSLLGYEDWQNDWWLKNRQHIHEEKERE